MTNRAVKRGFLLMLLASLSVAAVLGVAIIALGTAGEMTGKLLGTALTIGGVSLVCSSASLAWEKGGYVGMAVSGIVITIIAGFMVVGTIWLAEPLMGKENWRIGEMLVKSDVTACCFGAGFSLAATILIPRLRELGMILQVITVGLVGCTVTTGISLMWLEPRRGEDLWRLFGVMFVLMVAGTVSVPLLARFLGIKTEEEIGVVARTVWLRCPRCLREQEMKVGEGRCGECKLKFKIEVEEPRCMKCGYILHGLTRPICPECGERLGEEEMGAGVKAEDAGAY